MGDKEVWLNGQPTTGHIPHPPSVVEVIGQSHVYVADKLAAVKVDPINVHGGLAAGEHHVYIQGKSIQIHMDPISCGDKAVASSHVKIN